MPTADANTTQTTAIGRGIAAALVNVGQGLMLGNGDGMRAAPPPSLDGIPDLKGLDVQAQLDLLTNRLEVENRIKDGAENLLQVLESGHPDARDDLRRQVDLELRTAKTKITNLVRKLNQLKEELPSSSRALRKNANGVQSANRGTLNTLGPRWPNQPTPFPSIERTTADSEDKEDFKTSFNQANALIESLASSATRAEKSNSPASQSSSATSSSATSEPPGDLDRSFLESLNKLVAILQRNIRVRYELNGFVAIQHVLAAVSDSFSKETRAAAYRAIRHLMVKPDIVQHLQQLGIEWYLVRTLARDSKHGVEKEQAIKLIRAIVSLGPIERTESRGTSEFRVGTALSESTVRGLVAVAEHVEEPFRLPCLLTLAEILLIDVELVSRAGGIRVLLQTLVDGPNDLAPVIAAAILRTIDAPGTRAYIEPGSDLEVALSGFTDAYGKGTENTDRMKSSSRVISVMLRTWSGLMYLCMNDMHAIRALVDTLRIPSLDTREIILDTFFEVLNIKTPEWYKTFLEGRRLTMYRHQDQNEKAKGRGPSVSSLDTLNISDQFIALLLLIFNECGLLDALVDVLEEPDSNSNFSRKITLLVGEILHISNRILPLQTAAKIQSLPRLFELVAQYGNNDNRQLASNTFSSIDSFSRNRARLQLVPRSNKRVRANSVEDPMRRGQRQVEQTKIQLGMQIDDRAFQQLLIETQVMITKDHTKWNFEVLNDLIEGPLLNPKRLEEALRVSKFGRRLMSFFHPLNHRFSDIQKTKPNSRYVKMGCALLTTLIKSPDGARFLAHEDPLLPQLAECFNQIDPFNGTPAVDPVFSVARVEDTLTAGYFELLGTMSKFPEGIELMERHRLFTSFYHISELRSRDDLIKGIVENIDYAIDGHPRIVLSKALTSSYKHIRLYATKHLGQLIRDTPKANEWTMRLLLTQLYDPAIEVAELAIKFLEDACEGMDILELVVKMQPTLDHLGDVGHPLLLKFMSTSVGFRYLYHSDYIDREMDSWFHERNYQYVVQIEVYLARAFSPLGDEQTVLLPETAVPSHFYGEMTKTPLGCQVLQEKGHFSEFSYFIRQHGLEEDDFEIIGKLKSVLWAVGNIGSTPGGLLFLEEEDIIPIVVEIAEQSLVLSVRGTCFYVLGLISSTSQGAEILAEFGWDSTLTPLRTATGLCVPRDLMKFLHVPVWDSPPASDRPRRLPLTSLSSPEREILVAISNLSNTVIANDAARTLARLKSKHQPLFSSIRLYCRVLRMLSTLRYRLPVRRYILELFEVRLDPGTVRAIVNQLSEDSASVEQTEWDDDGENEGEGGRDVGITRSILLGPHRASPDDMDSFEDAVNEGGRARVMNAPVAVTKYIGFDA